MSNPYQVGDYILWPDIEGGIFGEDNRRVARVETVNEAYVQVRVLNSSLGSHAPIEAVRGEWIKISLAEAIERLFPEV